MKQFTQFLFIFISCINLAYTESKEEFFSLKVYPLLKEKCFGCHGDDPGKIKGDFDMRSLESLLKGGESGEPGLVKGKAEKSPVYQSILWKDPDFEMPPKENDRLTQDQINVVKIWIDHGAVWTDKEQHKKILQVEKQK